VPLLRPSARPCGEDTVPDLGPRPAPEFGRDVYGPDVKNALGFIWTLPNTLLGLLAGALTFQAPRVQEGVLVFDRAPRGLTWLLLRMNRSAMTVGFVIVSARPLTPTALAHERHHIRQYCRWGPLFIPVYLALAVAYGYWRHPFEIAARRAAGEE
jgi:hypothetical protein